MKLKISTAALSFIATVLTSHISYAESAIKITGNMPTTIEINHNHSLLSHTKNISLMKIQLSKNAAHDLAVQLKVPYLYEANNQLGLPPAVSISMNGVPVLDQGAHGTCVTFAVTGALDALYGYGDYVSQLCNLELGSFLEKKYGTDKYLSGWDGSFNQMVLQQIADYGFIKMDKQKSHGCGDPKHLLKTYPLYNELEIGTPMSDIDFKRLSESITNNVYWRMLLNIEEFDDVMKMNEQARKARMKKLLNEVKTALYHGHRVVFAVLLDVNQGGAGTMGTYHAAKDSWILTENIIKDADNEAINAGHAMIITAYDDNAEILSVNHKTRHKGVLTLRNSWNEEAGDAGNYYMSYEYFEKLAVEAAEISSTPFKN